MTNVVNTKSWTLHEWTDGSHRSYPEPEEIFDTFIDVTPPGISLDPDYVAPGDGGNYGIESVGADASNPGHAYFFCHVQGVWKTENYGRNWVGPLNTGTHGADITASAGYVTVVSTGGIPILYVNIGRGILGFYRSTDGGENWSKTDLSPPLPDGREDIYPNVADPYDNDHVLNTAHEQNYILESFDGGDTWASITMPTTPSGGSGFIFFIDTGVDTTTALTWLWLAQLSGGLDGTWRTTDGGDTWTQVSKNEHSHGGAQICQPNTSGTVYMCGFYADEGEGILVSEDYGETWAHVGPNAGKSVIVNTQKKLYAGYGWDTHDGVDPGFIAMELDDTTGTWAAIPDAPDSLNGGPSQACVMYDGTHSHILWAVGNSGVYRFVES